MDLAKAPKNARKRYGKARFAWILRNWWRIAVFFGFFGGARVLCGAWVRHDTRGGDSGAECLIMYTLYRVKKEGVGSEGRWCSLRAEGVCGDGEGGALADKNTVWMKKIV